MKEDFFKENAKDWTKIHHDIFGDEIPAHHEWTDVTEIISVLDTIGRVPSSNHAFFPMGGGLDLEGATTSREPGCIELDFGIAYIVKPKKLIFEGVDDKQEWNYFRLETLPLAPSGVYEMRDDAYDEEVVDLGVGNYIHRNHWDEGSYHGEPLPRAARPIIRIFKGAIVIFKKMSWYNHGKGELDGYDGRHEKLGAEKFKAYIGEAFAAIGNEPMQNPMLNED